jgi:histidinol-phosphatase
VIDPIDGTNNYIAGIPIWATLVALQVEGRNVVGVAHAPALNETYDAAIGAGARMNGTSIAVDPVTSLDEATFLYADAREFREKDLGDFFTGITDRTWRSRGIGDFWGHMLVARGAAHIMVEPELSVWDVAALEPIVTEAGGTLTHLDGTPWTATGSAVTTNGVLHEDVLGLVG